MQTHFQWNMDLSGINRFYATKGHISLLHYALGLRFGNVCEQKASKRPAKLEQNASKTRAKCN